MNRTVLIGGVAAVAVLVGTAGYLIYSGSGSGSGGAGTPTMIQGPVTTNPVTVISEYTTNVSQDGKRLSLGFPAFELRAKAGETVTSVVSTSWNIRLPVDERVVVATATVNGFMKSAATPPAATPAPAATPDAGASPAPAAEPATPAASSETPPADAAPAAEVPPAPAPEAPPGPAPGDGVVRLVVTVAGEATVTEWKDPTGAGLNRRLSRAASLLAAERDLRDGGLVPVTVTVEVAGGTAMETLAKMNSIDVQLFTENAPLPQPAAEAPAAEPVAPPADAPAGATPATDAPAAPPATTP
jgi:hypothetical protein